MAAIGRIIANQSKIAVRGIEVSIEGELDTDRLLGKPSDKRTGFSSIAARVKIDADLSLVEKETFLRKIEERCPVSENLANVTPVSIMLA